MPNLLSKILNRNIVSGVSTTEGDWFELWSRLYHQGSIYSASYAAVPILVDSIPDNAVTDINFFLLPASIEIARNKKNAPKITTDLQEEYFNAIKRMSVLAERHGTKTMDVDQNSRKIFLAIKLIGQKNIVRLSRY